MKLKREIGKKALLLLTINAILGTGIFFIPAIAALYAGQASILAWIIMAMLAVVTSIYFAELMSMFPRSGGIYEYTKRAFGEFPSFIVGWISWIVASITISMLIAGSITYLVPGADIGVRIILSITCLVIFNYVSYRGINYSKKMLMFFGAVTLFSLAAIIVGGLPHVSLDAAWDISIQLPLLLLTAYFISETYFGLETTAYLSEEIKNPRIMPKIIVLATTIIAAITLLVVFVVLANPNWQEFSSSQAPFKFLATEFFGDGIGALYSIIIFLPLIGTAASWVVSSPRLLYAMSRDKVLVPRFSKVHPKYKTPHHAIFFQMILTTVIIVVGFASYTVLLSLLIPLVTIMYSMVLLSVVKLRIDMPHVKRTFSAPFARSGPVLLVAFHLVLLYVWLSSNSSAIDIFLLDAFFVLFGIPLYIIIKLRSDEKFVENFYNSISIVWDRLFNIWYGYKEIRKILEKLHLKKDYRVLDFGAGSGITTIAVAEYIGKDGLVVAVDLSEKQLIKAIKKTKRIKHPNIIFIKGSRMSFPKNSFDAVAMVNVIEHLKNPEKEIRSTLRYLKKGGSFSALSFGKSFGIAAPDHVSSEKKIKELFMKAGMKVKIRRETKNFAEYWYIWGRK